MKICFLGPSNSIHLIKLCDYFLKKKYDVHVISFINHKISGVKLHYINTKVSAENNDINKIFYINSVFKLRSIINNIKPDIINVHYASSYGFVAALANIKNYVLSIWGSDILVFPKKSILHKLIVKYSLYKPKQIFSTSRYLANEANSYTNKKIKITPFGVDMKLFSPTKRSRTNNDKNFVVGTVKGLNYIYGIDNLVKAIYIIKNNFKNIHIKCIIAGDGIHKNELKKLARDLNLDDIIVWLGHISQKKAAEVWANMDLAIIPSRSESYGVAAIEAQACGIPVIISNCNGLLEVTKKNKTSIILAKNTQYEIANKIVYMYNNKSIRNKMSKFARKFVEDNFEINSCFDRINNLLSC